MGLSWALLDLLSEIKSADNSSRFRGTFEHGYSFFDQESRPERSGGKNRGEVSREFVATVEHGPEAAAFFQVGLKSHRLHRFFGVLTLGDCFTGNLEDVTVISTEGAVGEENALGWMPASGDIDLDGLAGYSRAQFDAAQRIDNDEWRQELVLQEELFEKLSSRMPKELVYERELLKSRLGLG